MSTTSKMILWYAGLIIVFGSGSFAAFHFDHPTVGVLVMIIPCAMIANGFIAAHEDNVPGGFNHPNTKSVDEGVKKAELNQATTVNDLPSD